MDVTDKVRTAKDRLRIFFILYYFSEDYTDPARPDCKRLFKSEVKIQKLDFLIRNPDYLCYELLSLAKTQPVFAEEIKIVIKTIFNTQEPELRRLEMERFFFGAYEDIDDVISFLKGVGFINFSSKKSTDLKTIEKSYFITEQAIAKVESTVSALPSLLWYKDRCELIKKYFGDLSGSDLKVSQYRISEYRNTSYKSYIGSINGAVLNEYISFYQEQLL